MSILIASVSVAIGISFLCSLLEGILYSTRTTSLEAAPLPWARQARAMLQLKSEVDSPLAAILILNTLAHTIGASVAGWAAAEIWGAGSLWVFSLVFTLAVLLISEILPKTIGVVYWPGLWRWAALPLLWMTRILTPLVWLTCSWTRYITKHGREKGAVMSEEEIVAAARLGEVGGEISHMEAELIRNIIDLEKVSARDIMTPRTVMLAVEGDRSLAEVLPEARQWPYSRVPVYEGDPDHISGYVLKDELCSRVLGPGMPGPQVNRMIKPIHFVPASANALILLGRFLKHREHIAMVVDEYGGVMGLVTLEDVLETLVGSEIVDEMDLVDDLRELARGRGRSVLQAQEEDQA